MNKNKVGCDAVGKDVSLIISLWEGFTNFRWLDKVNQWELFIYTYALQIILV